VCVVFCIVVAGLMTTLDLSYKHTARKVRKKDRVLWTAVPHGFAIFTHQDSRLIFCDAILLTLDETDFSNDDEIQKSDSDVN
jgi:hypothetical protein